MKCSTTPRLTLAAAMLAIALLARSATSGDPAPPRAQVVTPGVWLIPGSLIPGREPDGNTVIFEAPAGLIVVDTGRHAWHRQAILEFAQQHGRGIAAIVNSHWHLDHVSGNPALRAAYPKLRVYASDAIDRALSGFLAASVKDSQQYLADPQLPEDTRADLRSDLATIGNGAALRPDVVVSASRTLWLGGRAFHVHLARNAATSGDVWLFDSSSGVAALGDLVTLPAPFLDTACPDGWKRALATVTATPFRVAIPGHGAPMSPAQVRLYRRSFEVFVDCSNSARPGAECAAGWAQAVQPLLGADPGELRRARDTAAYYVGLLRANGGRSKYCELNS